MGKFITSVNHLNPLRSSQGWRGGGEVWWSPRHIINLSPVELSGPLFIFGQVPDKDDKEWIQVINAEG